ncbi:DNA-binding transcriptional MerR regulator [Enterococcus sp. PF1-24]|uniref:MerR family transcriptional regulator n=1 Tax=unclassified Enterococcus TaxID=2608891 RepID=UPI0024760127|nr:MULTISPECIES: MerR family transcriptional regulator [unclassified Enterococcus]MDH6365325.1 DNA-binding transcriptional MerR regulator [Enterococcus sp. PFB1-1]MDH6402419.1 DNA-binding transcriptional MerR regulator [Enterococcus sp. PF1-24]
MYYNPHEVAEMLNTTIPTLHYYEKADLLPTIQRNSSGARIYSSQNIEWLQMIILMRAAEIPIKEIRNYSQLLKIGPTTSSERYQLIKMYKKTVETRIANMLNSLKWLEAKTNFYQEMLAEKINYTSFTEESQAFKESLQLTGDFLTDRKILTEQLLK